MLAINWVHDQLMVGNKICLLFFFFFFEKQTHTHTREREREKKNPTWFEVSAIIVCDFSNENIHH